MVGTPDRRTTRVPTQFRTRQGAGNPVQHTIQEPIDEFTAEVNAALGTNTKFVTVTGEDGKKYAVKAATVFNIKET